MTKSRRKSNDKTPLSVLKIDELPLADSGLMNELVAATGRSDKAEADKLLLDLQALHEPLVLNVLRAENVPAHDRDLVSADVWKTIDRAARKVSGSKGAWDPGRGFGGACPFVSFLRGVCRSRARDYHDMMTRARRRQRRIKEAAVTYGDQWQSHGGSPVKAAFPKKRGGNLKQTEPPVSCQVLKVGRSMLAEALKAIPERQRRSLELHAAGLNNEEIAAEVGVSAATVSRDLTAARKKLRRQAEAAAG
jgi:RNA polymerase sigma factor (sigma-70 family)